MLQGDSILYSTKNAIPNYSNSAFFKNWPFSKSAFGQKSDSESASNLKLEPDGSTVFLRDDEVVYRVSIGHHEAVAVGN